MGSLGQADTGQANVTHRIIDVYITRYKLICNVCFVTAYILCHCGQAIDVMVNSKEVRRGNMVNEKLRLCCVLD